MCVSPGYSLTAEIVRLLYKDVRDHAKGGLIETFWHLSLIGQLVKGKSIPFSKYDQDGFTQLATVGSLFFKIVRKTKTGFRKKN